MDPNNYFSAFLPQQFQLQQQQIPIEHLIANNNQHQQIFNNNIFATTATNNNIMPTLTPIAAGIAPAATSCYVQTGPPPLLPPAGLAAAAVYNNNNNFGGNSLSTNITSSSFHSQIAAANSSSHLPFQQPQQPFLQISLSPSIPQPISVIIDGQQYLEFPSTNPGEQSQYIPLQLFLQPQNYISQSLSAEIYPQPIVAPAAANNFSSNPPPQLLPQPMSLLPSSSTTQSSILNQTQNLSNLQQPKTVKMDTTIIGETVAATISPPLKTRRTKSPLKQQRISNENSKNRTPQTQISLHKFFSPTQTPPSSSTTTTTSNMNISDDDIQVLDEKIGKKYIPSAYDDVQFVEIKPSISNNNSASTKTASKRNNKAAKKSAVNSTPNVTQSTPQPSTAGSNKRTLDGYFSPSSANTSANHKTVTISPNKIISTPSSFSTTSNVSVAPSSTAAAAASSITSTTSASSTPSKSSAAIVPSTSTAPTPVEEMDESESPSPLEQRLQTRSTLNSRVSPTFDYKLTTEIIREIVPIILEVIPNAIINGIGPAYHECGSFLNLGFDEDTREIAYVWFFFSLSIMIGDKQKKELQTPEDYILEMWIKEIETKFHDANLVQDSVIRTQRGAQKLIFEHKTINAKVTLLFCAEDACKRSQLIRLYTRFHTRIVQVAYLYNNMIMSNPELHLFTNTPLCYMIIYFLQQTDRLEVIHQSSASALIEKINLFQPPDYRTEDICHLISKDTKHKNDSVAFLTYEFAKFYSTFDFEKIIIDISQKQRRIWSKKDAENKKPIAVRCCFSGKNLAAQVSALCLSTFQKKMKEIIQAFEAEKEATVFSSDLEEFAKNFDAKSHK